MSRRRASGRPVNGILLFDKPIGRSSNSALQQVKRIYSARKAGHTGSLDPLASGLLPVCFGAATKLSAYLLDADKGYRMRARLGVSTTTGDAEGDVTATCNASAITREALLAAMDRFTGTINQTPPMYSAIRHQGRRLYALAREGVQVERAPRAVTIHSLTLLGFEDTEFELEVLCSKGTYVRTLAEDIGAALGVGAHVTALRRTVVGPFRDDALWTLEALEDLRANDPARLDEILLPMDTALGHLPEVRLDSASSFYLRQGQPVLVAHAPTAGLLRVYDSEGDLLAVGEIDEAGMVAPKRLLKTGG